MPRRSAAALAFALCLSAGLPGSADAQPARTAAPAAAPKPLSTDQQLAFLASARVVSTRPIGKGVTGALRVTLTDGTLTHDAAFQRIAEEPRVDGRKRVGELRFADHYRYNIAAWRLAVALGLGQMMPPTIERGIEGSKGALSWWMDDVLMDETERDAKNVQPPRALPFVHQRQRMAVFAELVRDTDRNKGNVIYTRDWRVIMLDFSRAFRLETSIRKPGDFTICDRALLAAMRKLTLPQVEQAVDDTLTESEIKAVLARRDVIVAHFDQLIATRGEKSVLY